MSKKESHPRTVPIRPKGSLVFNSDKPWDVVLKKYLDGLGITKPESLDAKKLDALIPLMDV